MQRPWVLYLYCKHSCSLSIWPCFVLLAWQDHVKWIHLAPCVYLPCLYSAPIDTSHRFSMAMRFRTESWEPRFSSCHAARHPTSLACRRQSRRAPANRDGPTSTPRQRRHRPRGLRPTKYCSNTHPTRQSLPGASSLSDIEPHYDALFPPKHDKHVRSTAERLPTPIPWQTTTGISW